MIEIRVNNGVIEYRQRAHSDANWGGWQQAQEVPETFKGMKPGKIEYVEAPTPVGMKVGFDFAAGINAADWEKLAKDIGPKAGVTHSPVYSAGWFAGFEAAASAGPKVPTPHGNEVRFWYDEAHVWQRKFAHRQASLDSAIVRVQELERELADTKSMLRMAEQTLLKRQKEIVDLHAELDSTHKRMVALQEDNRRLTNANQVVRDQRNRARMEAIEAERKRVDTCKALEDELQKQSDTMLALQQYRITERELLLRARGLIAMFTPAGKSRLLDDIDAALKG